MDLASVGKVLCNKTLGPYSFADWSRKPVRGAIPFACLPRCSHAFESQHPNIAAMLGAKYTSRKSMDLDNFRTRVGVGKVCSVHAVVKNWNCKFASSAPCPSSSSAAFLMLLASCGRSSSIAQLVSLLCRWKTAAFSKNALRSSARELAKKL